MEFHREAVSLQTTSPLGASAGVTAPSHPEFILWGRQSTRSLEYLVEDGGSFLKVDFVSVAIVTVGSPHLFPQAISQNS